MTNEDIIVELTRENMTLKAERKLIAEMHSRVLMRIVGIGGPLNDNKKGYTKEQQLDFFNIKEDIQSFIK